MASVELVTGKMRYVGGVVRLLLRLIPVKWEVRPDYVEPVRQEVSPVEPPGGLSCDE